MIEPLRRYEDAWAAHSLRIGPHAADAIAIDSPNHTLRTKARMYERSPMAKTAFEVGLIRVITCDKPALGTHGRLVEHAYPGLHVESLCIPDQPEGIHSDELEAIAVPKVVALACSAFSEKGAVLVSCAEDPGVPEIRAALPHTPVIGAGEAACAMALRYGTRVGVLGITDKAPKAYVRMLGNPLFDGKGNPLPHKSAPEAEERRRTDDARLESEGRECARQARMTGCLIANVRPCGVHTTLDPQTPKGRAACVESAHLLKRLGAEVIALGCTGMATIGIAGELENATGLPVVDPVLAMGAFAAFEAAKGLSR